MNILILCTEYSLEENHSWLIDSLAEELAKNHSVSTIYLDWKGKHGRNFKKKKKGVDVYCFQSKFNKRIFGSVGSILKWFFSSRLIRREVANCLNGTEFNIVINFSPALIMHPLTKCISGNFSLVLINWDFFPIYHFQLGLIPKPLFQHLKRIENSVYNECNVIGLMSPRNVDYLKSNYAINRTVSCQVVPLWGPSKIYERQVKDHSKEPLVCVFGGQLIPGRGINIVIDLAVFSKKQGIDVIFEIYGDGPDRDKIIKSIADNNVSDLVLYRGFRPRENYLESLLSADVGLVFNSGEVEVPTIPSKCIDFFRTGLPILAYVEEATDFGEILEKQARAGWSFTPATKYRMLNTFKQIAEMPQRQREIYGSNGQRWYLENMTVDIVSQKIIDLAS